MDWQEQAGVAAVKAIERNFEDGIIVAVVAAAAMGATTTTTTFGRER